LELLHVLDLPYLRLEAKQMLIIFIFTVLSDSPAWRTSNAQRCFVGQKRYRKDNSQIHVLRIVIRVE
jgi:hypothetical protein